MEQLHVQERLDYAQQLQTEGHHVKILIRAGEGFNLSPRTPLPIYTYQKSAKRKFAWEGAHGDEVKAGRAALRDLLNRFIFDVVHVFGGQTASTVVAPELEDCRLPWLVHMEHEELRSCLLQSVFQQQIGAMLHAAHGVTTSTHLGHRLIREWTQRSAMILPAAQEPNRQLMLNVSRSHTPIVYLRLLGYDREHLNQVLRLVAALQADTPVLAHLYAPGHKSHVVQEAAVARQAQLRIHDRISPRMEETLMRYSNFYLQLNDDSESTQIERNLLKAMRYRAAVLTTRHPLVSQITRHMETALVVPGEDEQALLTSARFLIEFPDKQRALAERGQQFANWYLSARRVAHEATAAYHYYVEEAAKDDVAA